MSFGSVLHVHEREFLAEVIRPVTMGILVADSQAKARVGYRFVKAGCEISLLVGFAADGVSNVYPLAFTARPEHGLKDHVKVIYGGGGAKTESEFQFPVSGQ